MSEANEQVIPEHPEELTAEWLTAALRARGHLREGAVRSVKISPVGDGEGFMGVLARLSISYSGEAGDAPASLIAKLPTQVSENRMMGELMGAYWREIHFYEELGARVPVRTPRVYYSDLTADPMRARQYKIVAVLDYLPYWFVARLMTFSKKKIGGQAHRYVLLIEDLAPARPGDQVAGGSPEVCAAVLRAVAPMHATFWRSPELRQRFWLQGHDVNPRIRHRMYLDSRESFRRRFPHHLRDGGQRHIDFLDEKGASLGRALHRDAPPTLIHCDLRFDNIFFDAANADAPVILADWQLAGIGAAAYDVAYVLSGALSPDTPEDVEQGLLRGYHDELLARGVSGYAFDRFLRDYQRGLIAVLQVMGTIDAMQLDHERGAKLIDLWVERIFARLRNVSSDALLG